jgi:hypothetical protein
LSASSWCADLFVPFLDRQSFVPFLEGTFCLIERSLGSSEITPVLLPPGEAD